MSKKLITGTMAEKNTCPPKGKMIIMKLMQSQLENIMKSKVMKKRNNLPVQKTLNCKVEKKKISTRLIKNSHLIL